MECKIINILMVSYFNYYINLKVDRNPVFHTSTKIRTKARSVPALSDVSAAVKLLKNDHS